MHQWGFGEIGLSVETALSYWTAAHFISKTYEVMCRDETCI